MNKARNTLPSQLIEKLARRAKKRIQVALGTGCWTWPGALTKGYGTIGTMIDGKVATFLVHRILWMEKNGPIPDGLEIDHLCRNPLCSNPDHLELVTRSENNRRGELRFARPSPETIEKAAQLNRAKTHCPKGHPYEGSNLVVSSRPRHGRICRICKVEWTRAWRAKKAA